MIQISESRLLELIDKENKYNSLVLKHEDLEKYQKLTPAAKRYKKAFETFLANVEEVLNSEEFKSIFQIAYIHGFQYKGKNLAPAIEEAKKVLK